VPSLGEGLYCFMVVRGRAFGTADERVVMTRRLDGDEIIMKRSALRDPSRQRNVANLSGFADRAPA
jgi:hypothetical protein